MRRHTNEHALKLDSLTTAELIAIVADENGHRPSDDELHALASRKIVDEIDDPPVGHREPVPASFWVKHFFACLPNGEIRVGRRLPPNADGSSETSFTFTANWVFYLWQPDCMKVWPALTPQEIDVRKAKPRPARKRLTRKASQRVDTGSAIEAGDSAAASGSLYPTEAGNTAAVAGRLKRKRRGKLTAEQIRDGLAYLRDHPELKPKQAYPKLRNKLKTSVSDSTLWRRFWKKSE
jgi:hypothetical protein